MRRWFSRPPLPDEVPPEEVKIGEVFAVVGVRYRCTGLAYQADDPTYMIIPALKLGLPRPVPVKKGDLVQVSRQNQG